MVNPVNYKPSDLPQEIENKLNWVNLNKLMAQVCNRPAQSQIDVDQIIESVVQSQPQATGTGLFDDLEGPDTEEKVEVGPNQFEEFEEDDDGPGGEIPLNDFFGTGGEDEYASLFQS